MDEEIEIKLALPVQAKAAFLRLPLLAAAGACRTQRLVSIYYDTPDLDLRRAGIALRLRRHGRQWRQTVKCRGLVAGGLTQRPEWETPYAGSFDFSGLPDATAKGTLEAHIARLQPIFATHIARSVWRLSTPEGGTIELCLDIGRIEAEGRREPICEIEAELLAGDGQALFACARSLIAALPAFPETASKADRGYRLYQNQPPAPIKARAPDLSARDSVSAALAVTLAACLEHLAANRHGALDADDPEFVHQMRVAARRLRSALRLFAPVFPDAALLRKRLNAALSDLGRVRDLDVFALWLAEELPQKYREEPAFTRLGALLAQQRRLAHAALAQALTSSSLALAILDLQERCASITIASRHADEEAPTAKQPLAGFMRQRLAKLAARMLQRAHEAEDGDPDALHRLRIAIKQMRYALEFAASLAARPKEYAQAHRRLVKFQEHLGEINDYAQFEARLKDLAAHDEQISALALRISKLLRKRRRARTHRLIQTLAGLHAWKSPKLMEE
ncbi:MAG: CHAD domain-containing protein [Rhodocyclaceae bacterium]|nr:CHAD domain-containing protein [Rhodocyclaceae bacterium]